MKTSVLAKIFAWAQFLAAVIAQATQGGLPHGVGGWLTLLASLAAAVGIHAASNTSGTT